MNPFTHPQAILGVYDILLSDEYNLSYIKKCPGSSKLYNGSEWPFKSITVNPAMSHDKSAPHGSGRFIKAF